MDIVSIDEYCYKTQVPKLKVIQAIDMDGNNPELSIRLLHGRIHAKRVMLTEQDIAYLTSLPKFQMYAGCFSKVIKKVKSKMLQTDLVKKAVKV